jgi:UDP-N-acetylglucosamine diphosphorylase / glucose-1-phosphate thymidylyltransferase / UDP-N-acetylgalactosamine diphosphorylase / glucosamine-1-phosphate N-acetyltransferase / galactosamine-1-phosphate N-acetyltransferase
MRQVNDFFDLDGFPFADVFDGVNSAWEALDRIGDYIKRRGEWKIEGEVSPDAWLQGDMIAIGEGSVVEPGAMIVGPALIGKNCVIRNGAYLRGKAIAGDGALIGHTTEVKNSIFLNGAKAAHFAYVGDSILGRGVNLGAGTKLANFKADTGNRSITVEVEGARIDTGRRKMGAILGDGVELGCNCVTMPGTLVGPGAIAYPCCMLRGAIPPRTIVKLRQNQQITGRLNN